MVTHITHFEAVRAPGLRRRHALATIGAAWSAPLLPGTGEAATATGDADLEFDRCGYVETQGSAVFAWCLGRGPGLLPLHGGLGASDDWLGVASRLHTRHRLIAFDQPGCGRSAPAATPLTYAGLASAATAVLDWAQQPRSFALGTSDGAIVALMMAASGDGRLLGVVSHGANLLREGLRQAGSEVPSASLLRAIRRRRWWESASPALAAGPVTAHSRSSQLDKSLPGMQMLRRIRVPTCILHSENDESIALSHSQDIARTLGRPLRIIPGEGHFVVNDAPDLFSRIAQTCCDDLQAQASNVQP